MSSYLQLKKRAFMSIVNGVKGFVRTVSGVPPISLEDCVDSDSLIDWKLYGNSVQDGTPSPENSVPVTSVGEYDSETGKYKVPVVARGKNLLPNSDWMSGRTDNGFTEYPDVDYITEYTQNSISFNIPAMRGVSSPRFKKDSVKRIVFKTNQDMVGSDGFTNFYIMIQGYDDNNNKLGNKIISNNAVADTEYVFDFSTIASYGFYKGSTQFSFCVLLNKNALSDLMIYDIAYYADTDTAGYEPYHKPITTNLFLDEPLRKVGDYADYVDFGKGEVIRNTAEITFDGSEAWYKTDKFIYLFVRNMQSYAKGFSTHIVFSTLTGATADIYFYATAKVLRMYQSSENPHFSDIEAFKAFLTEQAETGTPVKVTYILAEPTRTPISIPKLPTIKGTTIYETGTSLNASNMEATYYSTSKGG